MTAKLINFSTMWSQIYYYCYENYKGLTKNPKWLLMRKMRYLSHSSAKSYQSSLIGGDSVLNQIDIDKAVTQLKTEGFYSGLKLGKELVQEILKFASSNPCYGNRKSNLGFYYHQKEQAEIQAVKDIKVGYYFNTAQLCPAIYKLQKDSHLLAIAARYLEQEPIHQENFITNRICYN